MPIQIKFQCGCGFKTDKPTEAKVHSNKSGHIMVIEGQVTPDLKGAADAVSKM